MHETTEDLAEAENIRQKPVESQPEMPVETEPANDFCGCLWSGRKSRRI